MAAYCKKYSKLVVYAWALSLIAASPFFALLPSTSAGATNEPPCAATTKKWRYDTKYFGGGTASITVDAVWGLPGTYCVTVNSTKYRIDEQGFGTYYRSDSHSNNWSQLGAIHSANFYYKQFPVYEPSSLKGSSYDFGLHKSDGTYNWSMTRILTKRY